MNGKTYRVAIVSLALGGCSATATPTTAPPANYRAAVVAAVKADFFDPYSIRDVSISAPLYVGGIFDGVTPIPKQAWIVCLKANAKNRMGGYTGIKNSVFVFDGERVSDALSGPDFQGQADQHCRSAAFQSFPEIENLG